MNKEMNLEMSREELYKNKRDFVCGLAAATVSRVADGIEVDYQVFVNVNNEKGVTEFLVLKDGDNIRARTCTGDSNMTILDELNHMLETTANDNTDFYNDVVELTKDSADPRFKQRMLNLK